MVNSIFFRIFKYKSKSMIKYNPEQELSKEELDKLGNEDFDSFLNYLDQKAEYLKKGTKPLDTYHLKRFASITAADKGEKLSDSDYKKLNKLGKQNESEGFDKEKHSEWVEKGHDVLKSVGVKNVKTHRSQWFD